MLVPAPTTSDTHEVRWWNNPDDGLLTGTLFSDGSGAHPRWINLRRAAWAAIQVDDFGHATAAANGSVLHAFCPMQVARGGDAYSIAMLARGANPLSRSL